MKKSPSKNLSSRFEKAMTFWEKGSRSSYWSSSLIIVSISLLSLSLFGCYPMPKEGEYSTLPTTNHPDVVGSHGNPLYFQ